MSSSAQQHQVQYYRFAIIGIWLIVLLLSVLLLLQGEISRIKSDFQALTGRLQLAVKDRIALQEISLEGFANFLSAMPELDLDRARYYVKRWRERYPEVYMMEIAQRLDHAERDDFVKKMRAAGYAGFEIHTFGFESDRAAHLSPEKDVYYPIVFIEPELPSVKGVLGLDLSDTSSILKSALERSYAKQRLVASKPFDLMEGRRGYVMYRPVVETPGESIVELAMEQELYTLIVVDASTLLPEWVGEHENLFVSLDCRNGVDSADLALVRINPGITDDGILRTMLPALEHEERIESTSQPFLLRMRYQIQWSDLNRRLFAIMLTVAVVTFLIAKLFERVINESRIEKEVERQRLSILANYDNITGLPNRILLLDRIEQAIQRANRQQVRFAVVFLDLDNFKSVNDQYGHEVGNQLLKAVGTRISESMRGEDTVARIHGDEFVIVLNDVHVNKNIEVVTKKLAHAFRAPVIIENDAIAVNASLGHAIYPDDGTTPEALLSTSDKRMYSAKRRSKIRVVDNL